MKKVLDLRGFSCPIPLIKTRDTLNSVDSLTVIVDELPAKENITKFAKSKHCQVDCSTANGEYTISINKG